MPKKSEQFWLEELSDGAVLLKSVKSHEYRFSCKKNAEMYVAAQGGELIRK